MTNGRFIPSSRRHILEDSMGQLRLGEMLQSVEGKSFEALIQDRMFPRSRRQFKQFQAFGNLTHWASEVRLSAFQ